MHYFPGTAATNGCDLGGFRQHTFIPSQGGGQKSEITVLAVLVLSGEPIRSLPLSCLVVSMAILHVLNMNRGRFNYGKDQGGGDRVAEERRAEIEVL